MQSTQLQFAVPDALLKDATAVPMRAEEVHVWAFQLEGREEARLRCEQLLSGSERARGQRFYHEHNRHAFSFGHGLMRHILARYCGRDAAELEFAAAEYGKPRLADAATTLRFNLSHSHGRALLAVSDSREVGIDIEQVSERTDVMGIASSYFCGLELDAIRGAPPEQQANTFFRYWAAKEAVLKAQGVGLHVALDAFAILFDADARTATVDTRTPRIAADWRVRSLPCDAGWFAAAAASGEDWRVRLMTAP